eukprot:scaffold63143_cov36-Tisochrysis_lutea.AAC.2
MQLRHVARGRHAACAGLDQCVPRWPASRWLPALLGLQGGGCDSQNAQGRPVRPRKGGLSAMIGV